MSSRGSILVYTLWWLLCLPAVAFATDYSFNVTRYGIEHGLPLNAVNDIVQDKNGYIYLATNEGLVRYDGNRMVVFNVSNNPTFRTNRIFRLYYDQHDNLWLLFRNFTLARFHREKLVLEHISSDIGEIRSLRQSDNGLIWTETQQGIYQYNPDTDRFERFQPPHIDQPIRSIYHSEDSVLYATTPSGLLMSSGTDVRFQTLELDPELLQQRHSIHVFTERNHLFFAHESGFYLLDVNTGRFLLFIPALNSIDRQVFAVSGSMYLLNSAHAYFTVDADNMTYTQEALDIDYYITTSRVIQGQDKVTIRLGNNAVHYGSTLIEGLVSPSGIFLDRDGGLWVLSQQEGVYNVIRTFVENITERQGLTLRNTYSILESKREPGVFWTTAYGSGIIRWSDDGARIWNTRNSNLPSNFAWYTFEDEDGSMFVSLGIHGVFRKRNDQMWDKVYCHPHHHYFEQATVSAMYRFTGEDRLLLGSSHGLFVKQEEGCYQLDAFTNVSMRAFREHPSGWLLAATNGDGVYALDGSLNPAWQLTTADGLNSNVIRDVYVQSADTLWVVTESTGLNRVTIGVDGSFDIRSLTTSEGLPHNSTHRMIVDSENRAWISSNVGITTIPLDRMNTAINNAAFPVQFIHINQRSGMLNREANGGVDNAGMLTSDGVILFPNQAGLTRIQPGFFYASQPQYGINPLIEGVRISDGNLMGNLSGAIQIPRGTRTFTIEFSAPDFSQGANLLVTYRMRGVDRDWQQADARFAARYTDVRPGRYVFEVMTSHANGERRSTEAIVNVPSFYYETYWFRILSVLLVLAILVASIRYRERERLRLQSIQGLINRQAEQIQQITDDRNRYLAGLSHDLRQPLSLIYLPLEQIKSSERYSDDVNLRTSVHIIERNASKMLHLVDQLQELTQSNMSELPLKGRKQDIRLLTRGIVNQFIDQPGYNHFPVHLEINTQEIYVRIDEEAYERILMNVLDNAYRHAYSDKGVHIRFEIRSTFATVLVQDFGKGLNPTNIPKLFDFRFRGEKSQGSGLGLHLARELVRRMQGELHVAQTSVKGTTFAISLPLWREEDEDVSKTAVLQASGHLQPNAPESDPTEVVKVLLVDDNAEYAEYLASTLRTHTEVYTSFGAVDAMQRVALIRPDIIVSDVVMGEMNGYEMVRTIREFEGFRHIPVIFLSGNSHYREIHKGLSSGADVYLTKPVHPEVLLSQIHAVCRREKLLDGKELPVSDLPQQAPLVVKVTEIVFRHIGNYNLSPELIAESMHMSRSSLYREWKKVSDISIKKYIQKIRLNEGRILTEEKGYNLKSAAAAVGMKDVAYFSRLLKSEASEN